MKITKSVENYIFISLGFMVLFLLFLFHLLEYIGSLLFEYNQLVDNYNKTTGGAIEHKYILFFTESYSNITFIVDLLIVGIIIIIFLMIFLKIYWSERNGSTK